MPVPILEMSTVVFLLEEESARDLVEGLLPRLVPEVCVQYLVFEGKQHLEGEITRKLRGWQKPGSRFGVLRDQDAGDCRHVKRRLVDLAEASGRRDVLVRVACREIESWLLGDWKAVALAFERPQLAEQAKKAAYRDPDKLSNPVAELRKYIFDYQKRDGARRIGRYLDPGRSTSTSFKVFCSGVRQLVGTKESR